MDELLVFVLVILLGLIGVVIILGVNSLYKIRDAVEAIAVKFIEVWEKTNDKC